MLQIFGGCGAELLRIRLVCGPVEVDAEPRFMDPSGCFMVNI